MRRPDSIRWARGLGSLLIGLMAGCGGGEITDDGLPREPVSGRVTWKGQPLAKGLIQFIPDGQGQVAPIVAPITDGRYEVAKAQGPVPGKYSVSVTEAVDGPPPEAMPGESPRPAPQSIPAKYNTKTTLTRDVKAGEANTFDFELAP
ncbi:hypothetical protein TA3x_001508 [Tundrisphaera sp. TA3]|uniref:hypothetical protein n=1 Tax=Tundrisphaera sp. TA3 TaxID=3435775 RepID=UPI003EC0E37C